MSKIPWYPKGEKKAMVIQVHVQNTMVIQWSFYKNVSLLI